MLISNDGLIETISNCQFWFITCITEYDMKLKVVINFIAKFTAVLAFTEKREL